jgi:multidrug efflux pump subunit AcrA (membrane-fusion protein)
MDMRKTDLPRIDAPLAGVTTTHRWRYALATLTIAVAAAVTWWFLARGLSVTVAAVTRGTAAEIVYATGAIEPLRWAKVTTLVKGRIIERCRCEGRFVNTGFVLARLDDAEAQAALRELRAREEFARKEVERQSQLVARGATSAQSFERAQTEHLQIQALIAAQIERLAYYRIHAPMDGVVLREEGEVGEIVDSNVLLYRIGIPTALQLVLK